MEGFKNCAEKVALERFDVYSTQVNLSEHKWIYQKALKDEITTKSIQNNNSSNIQGHELVGYVLEMWQEMVNRVAKKRLIREIGLCVVGQLYCEIVKLKQKIQSMQGLYKQTQSGIKKKMGSILSIV